MLSCLVAVLPRKGHAHESPEGTKLMVERIQLGVSKFRRNDRSIFGHSFSFDMLNPESTVVPMGLG